MRRRSDPRRLGGRSWTWVIGILSALVPVTALVLVPRVADHAGDGETQRVRSAPLTTLPAPRPASGGEEGPAPTTEGTGTTDAANGAANDAANDAADVAPAAPAADVAPAAPSVGTGPAGPVPASPEPPATQPRPAQPTGASEPANLPTLGVPLPPPGPTGATAATPVSPALGNLLNQILNHKELVP